MSAVQIQSMRPWHEKIIDYLLAHPGRQNYGALAAQLNVTPSWLSTVMHSDVFREEYVKRRQGHTENLTKEVVAKQLEITLKALDRVGALLDDEEEYDLSTALNVATQTAKAMNFAPSPGLRPVVATEVERTIRRVNAGTLEEARENMRRVEYTTGNES